MNQKYPLLRSVLAISVFLLLFLIWFIYLKTPQPTTQSWVYLLPSINASLNLISLCFMISGIIAIKNRQKLRHKKKYVIGRNVFRLFFGVLSVIPSFSWRHCLYGRRLYSLHLLFHINLTYHLNNGCVTFNFANRYLWLTQSNKNSQKNSALYLSYLGIYFCNWHFNLFDVASLICFFAFNQQISIFF